MRRLLPPSPDPVDLLEVYTDVPVVDGRPAVLCLTASPGLVGGMVKRILGRDAPAGRSQLRLRSVWGKTGFDSCVCARAVTTEGLDRQSEAMSDPRTTHHAMLEAGPVVFEIHHRDLAGVGGRQTGPAVRESWFAAQ